MGIKDVYDLKGEMSEKIFIYIIRALMIFALVGCSKEEMSGARPLMVNVNISDETYEAKLGTYCWKNECVDTAGPVELLEGKEPIKVKPGATITFVMDYKPKPNEFHLLQINEGNENEIVIKDNSFSAPTNKGVYYYSYGVWWMDDQEENVSNGDAFYSFSLEVE